MDKDKYRIKYGNTLVDVVHFKPSSMYSSTGEYITESKKLSDNLQSSKHNITCSPDDFILVYTNNGEMKMLANEYLVTMANGKRFIYRALDFLATFEKVK